MIYIAYQIKKCETRYLQMEGNKYTITDLYIEDEDTKDTCSCYFIVKTDANEMKEFRFLDLYPAENKPRNTINFFCIVADENSQYFTRDTNKNIDGDFMEWVSGEGIKIQNIIAKHYNIHTRKNDIEMDFKNDKE